MLRAIRLLVSSTIVSLASALVGCGGQTAQDTTGGKDASADTAPIQGTFDATAMTDSFVPTDASEDPSNGDDSTAMDASIDTRSDSAIVDGPSEAADARICVPATCGTFNYNCGYAADGCGELLNCTGPCEPPSWCGGGGFDICGGDGWPCGGGGCVPFTCTSLGRMCGLAGDGCGALLQCGTCMAPLTCGGGGVVGQCGAPDAGDGGCVPETCAGQGIQCGPAGDGCGNELMCGTCLAPETCGGAGTLGLCGVPDAGSCCIGLTCVQEVINCGPAGDGCGNIIQCGTCTPPQTCGGGGFARCG